MAFYVYIYHKDGVPIYVGKGKGARAWAHETRFSVKPEIVAEFEHEAEAFAHEAALIQQYGRVNIGVKVAVGSIDLFSTVIISGTIVA